MLNKPITHPTIKSFVYLDIDSRRDKGSPLPLSTKAAILGGTPLARSRARSLRAATLARPCGTIGGKRCTDVTDECGVRGFQT